MDAPPIQYCRTSDGVNIAYWTLGEGPTTLLLRPLLGSHLTLEWQVPRIRRAHEQYASDLRLIDYDPRQCGLSGIAEDLSLDAFIRDIQAVLAASGGGPAALITLVHTAPLAIGFAAAHPEAVSALVLLGPEIDYERRLSVQRALERSTPAHAAESLYHVVDPEGLGEDAEPMRKLFAHNRRSWQRLGVKDLMQEAIENWPVSDLFPQLTCPTLIVHYPGHAFSDGPNVAARIANARLLIREGANGPLFNPDLDGLTTLVRDFVLEHATQPARVAAPNANTPVATRSPLSPRELEVLRQIALGRTNAEIATALYVETSTINRHVHHILRKTKAHNRAEAVTWAFTRGLLQD